MTSITWAGPSCVQELGTFLAPQNRIQGRCVPLNINMDAKETSQNSLVQTLALSVLYNLDIALLETLGLTAYFK